MSNSTALELRTKRLLLRDFCEKDISKYQRVGHVPEAIRYYSQNKVEWKDHVVKLANRFSTWQMQEPRRNFALTILLDGEFVGVASIRTESEKNRHGSVGCGLEYKHWSKGYAAEALAAVINFGFDRLGFHRIYAETISENKAAVRMLSHLGMRLEGQLRHNQYFKGRWRDTLIFAVLRQEWNTR